MANQSSSILIIAAEESSAQYGEQILKNWKNLVGPSCSFYGVGNKAMENQGFHRLGLSEDLAVMGAVEVFGKIKLIKNVYNQIVEKVTESSPQCALLIDYPGFNLKMAKRLNELKVPVIYFISPKVWAWKSGRVELIKKYVDELLVIFPFEVDFYKKHGLEVNYVGNPLVEMYSQFKKNNDIGNSDVLLFNKFKNKKSIRIGLMPGSRKSELKNHLRIQVEAVLNLDQEIENIVAVLLLAPSIEVSQLSEWCPAEKLEKIKIIQKLPFEMISSVDVILCASGTATLMVALARKPMLVMYKMNIITGFLAKIFVNKIKHFSLVNILLNRYSVEEMFQAQVSPINISKKLSHLIMNQKVQEKLSADYLELESKLSKKNAFENVISVLKKYV